MSSSGETLCGAISPTTSVASACIPGASGNASIYLRSLAADENTCSTLPHMPTSSASLLSGTQATTNQSNVSGLPSTNLQLNRNLVMLRNHLRKNTSATANNTIGPTGTSSNGSSSKEPPSGASEQ